MTMQKWVAVSATAVGGFLLLCAGSEPLLEAHPEWLARAIAKSANIPEKDVSLEGWQVDLLGGSFTLRGLEIAPPGPNGLVVQIDRVEGGLPPLLTFWNVRHIDLGLLTVDGLLISQSAQQPAPPYEEPVGPTLTLVARAVHLTNGAFRAPADNGKPAVDVQGVRGAVHHVAWTPARRWVEGSASASAARLQIGAIELTDVWTDLVLAGDMLRLGPTSLSFAEADAIATGTVSNLRGRAAVEIRVMAGDQSLAAIVQTATGANSPVRGQVSVDVTLRSGGELPEGEARFEGWVSARESSVWLGEEAALPLKLTVSLAPWFRRMDDGWISLGDLQGRAVFGRGWVTLMQAERPDDEHRVLQAWGKLRGSSLEMLARVVPRRDSSRPGVGISVKGEVDAPSVRLASADELASAPAVWNAPATDSDPASSPSAPSASPPSAPGDRELRPERSKRRRSRR